MDQGTVKTGHLSIYLYTIYLSIYLSKTPIPRACIHMDQGTVIYLSGYLSFPRFSLAFTILKKKYKKVYKGKNMENVHTWKCLKVGKYLAYFWKKNLNLDLQQTLKSKNPANKTFSLPYNYQFRVNK